MPNTENGSLCAYVACARSSSHALGVTEVWLSVPTVMVLCAPGQCTVAHEWTTSAASRARLTTTRARKCNIVECCTADSGTSWQQKYVDVIPHTTAGPRASGFVGFRPGTLSANFRDGGRRVWLHSRHHGNQLLLSPVCFPGTFLLTQSLTRTVPSRLLQQSQLRPGGCVSTTLLSV